MQVMAHVIHAYGGPEQLHWEAVQVPEPGPGEVLLRHRAVGMNMMEIGLRQGVYPGPPPPFIPGVEAAAVVEAIGPGVRTCATGDRVGYAGPPVGSYAEARVYPAERLFPIPDAIDDETAAACMVKAMTAVCLLERTVHAGPGMRVLIHAAAGGTGMMCVQLAAHLGAEVFGTVSTDAKAERIRALGCEHPLVYTRENFADAVLGLTDGAGLDVIFDSVGRATFADSVRALGRFGTLGLFGVADGLPEPLELMKLDLLTSQYFVRPSLYAYTERREDLLDIAARAFDYVARGVLAVHIDQRLPLREAAQGHRLVESRQTSGSLVYTL